MSHSAAPYREVAVELYRLGLCPLPCPHESSDGKSPQGAVSGFGKWGNRPPLSAVRRWAEKHSDANVGLLTGLSGLTVVDIDDATRPDQTLRWALRAFGETPVLAETPSGGRHLYYAANGERSRQRLEGRPIDIKAGNGIIIAPPSLRRASGRPYRFLKGSFIELDRLPKIKPFAIPPDRKTKHSKAADPSLRYTKRGERNDALFKALLREAKAADDFDTLLDVANTRNQQFDDPLSDTEVAKVAGSVWRYESRGDNWTGGPPRSVITLTDLEKFLEHPNGSDALMLLHRLKLAHGGRDEPFAISDRAMYRDRVMGRWSRDRIRRARLVLEEMDQIKCVFKGHKKASRFVLKD